MTGSPQPAAATTDDDRDGVAMRAEPGPEAQVLDADARAWLSVLPTDVRPVQLPELYPRICNVLAAHWPAPERVLPVLNELLVDSRGGRQGFPLQIIMEITRLKKHFQETYAAKEPDIWDRTPGLY